MMKPISHDWKDYDYPLNRSLIVKITEVKQFNDLYSECDEDDVSISAILRIKS